MYFQINKEQKLLALIMFNHFHVPAKKLLEEQRRHTTVHKDKQQEAAVRPWQVLSQTVLMLKGCTNLSW